MRQVELHEGRVVNDQLLHEKLAAAEHCTVAVKQVVRLSRQLNVSAPEWAYLYEVGTLQSLDLMNWACFGQTVKSESVTAVHRSQHLSSANDQVRGQTQLIGL